MYSDACGEVIEILKDGSDLQEVLVIVQGGSKPERAYNYPGLYRKVRVGESVRLNTTAVKLGLGTGGRHFIIPGSIGSGGANCPGHIMKLRYTPWQFPVLAAEEDASPYHELLEEADILEGVPVVAAPLHSMLPGVILGFRNRWRTSRLAPRDPKITYIMTDGAALPIALSDLVRNLKEKKLLEMTITTGHAFGGDLETVSIPSALLTARKACKADLIIVALGPGIVGTGTAYGFSGIEQSWVIDISARLKGIPVAVPRISQADSRPRHLGISHHTLTILDLANCPCSVAISDLLPSEFKQNIINQMRERGLLQRHLIYATDDPPAVQLFQEAEIEVKTMGRGITDETAFFQSAIAAGVLAAETINSQASKLTRIR